MKNNRRLAAILAVIMAFWLGGHTVAMAAAIPMPILPYIPPQKVELYDLLNNAYGLTRLNITDDAKRLAAYLDLYVRIMGAANAEIIDKMIDGAQSSYKYKIKAELMNGVQSVMQEQIVNGYEEEISGAITGAQETYNALMEWNKINTTMLPYSVWTDFANRANAKYGVNQWTVYAVQADLRGQMTMCIGAVRKTQTMVYYQRDGQSSLGNGYYPAGMSSKQNYSCVVIECYAYYVTNTAGSWTNKDDTKIGTRIYNSNAIYDKYTLGGQYANRKAIAQNSAITTALQNGEDIPITADSVVTNGTLDRTKDVVITIPATRPIPAQDVEDLPRVQDELGVLPMPLTQDVAQTLTDLQAQSVATFGNTGEYALDLRNYFPFCLPFDIGNLLACFVAEPHAPSFEWQFPTGYDAQSHEFTMQTFTIDLSMWDSVAYWLRKGELALFIVGLAAVTRQWFLRG